MAENKANDPGKVRKRARTYVVTLEDASAGVKSKRGRGTFKFGLVRAKTGATDPQVKSANVAMGQASLKRAKGAFTKTGITLRRSRTVPVFHVDPKEPSVLIRRLDGREERGHFVDKEFVPF